MIYDFTCTKCSKETQIEQSINDELIAPHCSKCNGETKQKISVPAVKISWQH